jgi:nicotinate-nucleotide adenylyltransferase
MGSREDDAAVNQETMAERHIAAFGGTFDPIHHGHLEVMRAVVQNFRLDQLLVIPAHRPPHKDPRTIADAYHRYAMAVLGTLEEARVVVSTLELEAPDRPYTFETVERLRSMVGEKAKLYFIIGADSFEEINTWREPARLFSGADVIVVTRPGHDVDAAPLDDRFKSTIVDLRGQAGSMMTEESLNEHHIYLTDYVNSKVSSTEIRQRVRDGEPIVGLVPPRVSDYIRKYELYRR